MITSLPSYHFFALVTTFVPIATTVKCTEGDKRLKSWNLSFVVFSLEQTADNFSKEDEEIAYKSIKDYMIIMWGEKYGKSHRWHLRNYTSKSWITLRCLIVNTTRKLSRVSWGDFQSCPIFFSIHRLCTCTLLSSDVLLKFRHDSMLDHMQLTHSRAHKHFMQKNIKKILKFWVNVLRVVTMTREVGNENDLKNSSQFDFKTVQLSIDYRMHRLYFASLIYFHFLQRRAAACSRCDVLNVSNCQTIDLFRSYWTSK